MTRFATLFALILAACGGTEAPTEPVEPEPVVEPEPAPEPEEPAMADGVMFANAEALTSGPITSPVTVQMMVHGMTVQPAGEVIEGSGHHHIIINGEPVAEGEVVPSDEQHIHFGGGQTETELELPPGEHTLTLQFANGMHQSYGPDWSKAITVTVAAAAE